MKTLPLLLITLILLTSCKGKTKTQNQTPKHPRLSYEEYANEKWYYYYERNRLDSAQDYIEERLEKYPTELPTLTRYAELLRRQEEYVKADSVADIVLSLDSSDGDAWLVKSQSRAPIYGLKNKVLDTTKRDYTYYLHEGIKRDSTNGNLWEVAFDDLLKSGDNEAYKRGLIRLYSHGHYTPKVLEIARLYLRQLPPRAILVTAGDMDTYPFLAVQEAESLREDVIVINYNLMNLKWYPKAVFDLLGESLPCSESYLQSLKIEMTPNNPKSRYKTVAQQVFDTLARDTNRTRPLCVVSSMMQTVFDGHNFVNKGHYREIVKGIPTERDDLNAIAEASTFFNAGKLKGANISTQETAPILLRSNHYNATDRRLLYPYMLVAIETRRLHDSIHHEIEDLIYAFADSTGNKEPVELFEKYREGLERNKK